MNTADLDVANLVDPQYARAMTATFAALFVEPDAARRAFLEAVDCRGAHHASLTLRTDAEQFGPVITNARRPRHDAAEAGFFYAFELEGQWRSLILRELPMLLDADDRLASEHAVRIVTDHCAVVDRELAEMKERRARAVAAVREFAVMASCVYSSAWTAIRGIRAHLRHYGPDATYRALYRFPQQFGELHRTDVAVGFVWSERPVLRYRTSSPAQKLAKRLPALFQAAVIALQAKPTAGEINASSGRVTRAEHARRETEAAARRFPWSIEEYLQDTRIAVLTFVSTHNPPPYWRRLAMELAPMLPGTVFDRP